MSLNSLSHSEYLYKTQSLLALLQVYVAQWQAASTVERRSMIEARALSTLEDILDQYIEMPVVTPFAEANAEELNNFYTEYQNRVSVLSAKIRLLGRLFINYYNTQQIKLLDINSKMNRIRQKYATLGLWNTSDTKYVLNESFINHDNLAAQFEIATELAVFEQQGVVTLPIKDRASIPIRSIVIGSGSNGQPGNSNNQVEANTSRLANLLDQNPNQWFEYERLDSGPLKLELVLNLTKKEIINYISLDGLASGLTNGIVVKDVLLNGGRVVSIRSLLNPDLPEDFWRVKTTGGAHWECVFLPLEVSSVTLILEQSQVELSASAGGVRQRWAIGLNEVALGRLEFQDTGTLTSEVLAIPAGLYSTVASGGITPANPLLFDLQLGVSTGQESWEYQLVTVDKNTTFLLNGEPGFQWQVQLTRLSDALANNTDYAQPDLYSIEVESLLTSVTPFESPTEVSLLSKPRGDQVFAIQPKIAYRGTKETLATLGKGQGTLGRYAFPFDITAVGIEPSEVSLYVSRRLLEYNPSGSGLASSEWAFSDDYSEVILGDEIGPYSTVQFVIEPEKLVLSETAEGYVALFGSLFDPDKDNIKLSFLSKDARATSLILPKRKLIKLEHQNLVPLSVRFNSKEDLDWVRYESRSTFTAASDDYAYYVDCQNGLVYLNTSVLDDQVTLSYRHKSSRLIADDNFDVLYQGVKPVGVRIKKSVLETEELVDDTGVGPQGVFNAVSRNIVTRDGGLYANKFLLSRGQVIRNSIRFNRSLLTTGVDVAEVEFIDGESEFYGLVRMLDEQTTAISSGVHQYVSFSLSARDLAYLPLGVSFTDPGSYQSEVFATLMASATAAINGDVGDYHISDDGVVVVNTGANATLLAGINISYWYKDPNFDPTNKYSVDYKEGIIYTAETIADSVLVSYKAGVLQAEYSISQEIKSAAYSSAKNSIKIKTEYLNRANNLVKIFWAESDANVTLAKYKNYFSPILSLISFRFK